jgi:hypothetical protein
MGRWKPPPTQDPTEQAMRETAEVRELLDDASAEITAMQAQLRDLQAIVASHQQDKNNAVWLVQEALNETSMKWSEAAKNRDAWESIAWNLLNIGRKFSERFDYLRATRAAKR